MLLLSRAFLSHALFYSPTLSLYLSLITLVCMNVRICMYECVNIYQHVPSLV